MYTKVRYEYECRTYYIPYEYCMYALYIPYS